MKGDTIQFINCSEREDEYTLLYGDGSAEVNGTIHYYKRAGHYMVELIAKNSKHENSDFVELNLAKYVLHFSRIEITRDECRYTIDWVGLNADGKSLAYTKSSSGILENRKPVNEEQISLIDLSERPQFGFSIRSVHYELVGPDQTATYVCEDQLKSDVDFDLSKSLVYTDVKFFGKKYELVADIFLVKMYEEESGIYPR